MGQSSSHHNKHQSHKNQSQARAIPSQIEQAFFHLTGGEPILTSAKLEVYFGQFTDKIYDYLVGTGESLTLERFNENVHPLLENTSEAYAQIFGTARNVLEFCLFAVHVQPDVNNMFFTGFIEEAAQFDYHAARLRNFFADHCPGVSVTVHDMFAKTIFGESMPIRSSMNSSSILSPAQFFLLQSHLPISIFFPNYRSGHTSSEHAASDWLCLYSSHVSGLSVNRFERDVFMYKGPTVTIVQLLDDSIFTIATDQEWQNSGNIRESSNNEIIQISPTYERNLCSIYSNFKLKSSAMGIRCGKFLSINDDFSNVGQIEVWGCADIAVMAEKAQMQQRLQRAAMQRATVPLPGTWDDNPDKTIMEMAGFKFANRKEFDRPDDSSR